MIKLQQEDLINKKYLDIPYLLNGRDKKGIDCLGLIQMYLRDNGINMPDDDGNIITRWWWKKDPERYVRGLLKIGDIVPINFLQKNDIVLFVYSGRRRTPSHAGVMINSGWFLHILEDETSKVTQFNKEFIDRFGGAIRIGEKHIIDNRKFGK